MVTAGVNELELVEHIVDADATDGDHIDDKSRVLSKEMINESSRKNCAA